jgi:hypothetical protein
MKTKDMIALLQQLDPSGEGYVVVEGSGLRKDNVQVEACYYDGKPVVPLYDEQGEYCGARKMSSGTKLVFSRADTENDFLDRLLERQLEYIYTSDDKQTMGQTYLDTIASRFKWLQLARQEAPNTADGLERTLPLIERIEKRLLRSCDETLEMHLVRWVETEPAKAALREIRRKLSALAVPVATGTIGRLGEGLWQLRSLVAGHGFPLYVVKADGSTSVRYMYDESYTEIDPFTYDFQREEKFFVKFYDSYVQNHG